MVSDASEISTGKLVRLDDPEILVWLIVTGFRLLHEVLYHGPLVLVKLAVTVAGAFMVKLCGVVAPLNAPLNPVNWKPEFAVALTGTTVPAL